MTHLSSARHAFWRRRAIACGAVLLTLVAVPGASYAGAPTVQIHSRRRRTTSSCS